MSREAPGVHIPPHDDWIKADLHLHTAEDPFDVVDYTAMELLDRAHALGFRVLAVTLHGKVFDEQAAFDRARELGILLIPSAELRIDDVDVVVLNLTAEEAAGVTTFDDLRALRAARGDSLLVLAPHPFYILGGSMGGKRLKAHVNCFDAIEFCHFHARGFNPNAPATRVAARHGIPVLATSDAHQSRFFGQHYSLLHLEAAASPQEPPSIADVFQAIRAGRIRRVSPPAGIFRIVSILMFIFLLHPLLKRASPEKRPSNRKRGFVPGTRPRREPARSVT